MKVLDDDALKVGLISGIAAAVLCILTVIIVAFGVHENFVFFFLFAALPIFGLFYCFGYTLKAGIIRFLRFSQVKEFQDELPNSDYFKSQYEKDTDSLIIVILCFVPMLIFYILFSWIFYLVKA